MPKSSTRYDAPGSLDTTLAGLCGSASRTLDPRVLGNARKPRSRTRWELKQISAILDRQAW
eukprot:1124134-Pyramimonas_sp.AAC.1